SHGRRALGANHLPVDEACTQRSRAGATLAGLPAKSPRGDRSDGLLHGPDDHFWRSLREAFPFQPAAKFLIFDHDRKYGFDVPVAIQSMKIACVQTSLQSPWQNGVAERWVGSCRRDLLDHVIALNQRHLRRVLSDYVRYY